MPFGTNIGGLKLTRVKDRIDRFFVAARLYDPGKATMVVVGDS